MSFELTLLPELRLIFEQFGEDVSLEEVRSVNRQFIETVEQAETRIDMLVDMRAVKRFPASIDQLRSALTALNTTKLGWIVLLISHDPILELIATTLSRLMVRGGRIRVFDDAERAAKFLETVDPVRMGNLVSLLNL